MAAYDKVDAKSEPTLDKKKSSRRTSVFFEWGTVYDNVESGNIENGPNANIESGQQTTPRVGVTLEWSNINLTIGNEDKEKTLLHSMAGKAYPRQMLAVMGSSGAGSDSSSDPKIVTILQKIFFSSGMIRKVHSTGCVSWETRVSRFK